MKKFLALLLCLMMAFCFVACEDKKTNNRDNDDDGDSGGASKKSSVSFYVNYNSVKIELGADAKAVLAALGAPKSSSPMGNCAGQGTLTKYTYNSFDIYTVSNGNTETIDQITLLDDAVKCPEGVGIGSASADVLKACGANPTKKSDTGITYTSGSKNLIFSLRDGAVVGIDYRVISG
ncbi:MAG: hypothetical protein J6C39_04005 [Clostridia bacterium]|nr:hypothetical protein [Clostridia bacterium]MBO5416303.1 hypothetical protein [Clostridia bacterium]